MEKLEEDRLSSLPKIILHCILSKLPEKDVVRTSVLSKDWLDTCYTYPILSFFTWNLLEKSLRQPIEYSERMRKISGFCDYVKRRILRFRDQSLAIKEFELILDSSRLCNISNDVDIWLKLACECGVEVIKYSQMAPVGDDECGVEVNRYYQTALVHGIRYHVFPISTIEAKSITTLMLEGRYIMIDPTFMNHSIKFFSLRVLTLRMVLLRDQHTINNILSFCPLIESITLTLCSVLSSGAGKKKNIKSFSIRGLQNLKRVDTRGIQDVYIDAPSLETLCYYPNEKFEPTFKIDDFDRCRNLKELCLWFISDTFFTAKWFHELFLKFPFLESLKLNTCVLPKRIDISSVRLKVLELSNCYNLKEVKIDAPNLLSCGYKGHDASKPNMSFSRSSSQLEVNIHIPVKYKDLRNLRELVQNIKPNNVLTSLSLTLFIPLSNLDKRDPPVASRVSSPPPRIKHLALGNVPYNTPLYLSLANILLSSYCPITISFSIKYGRKEFIEFFYKTLMRRKGDECFCSDYDTKCLCSVYDKCWWHDLKDVKVRSSSMKMDENVDFKTILESLVLDRYETFIFSLYF